MEENSIIFKGSKRGITVLLKEEIEFAELKSDFLKKLEENKSFFANSNVKVFFKGRTLKTEEEAELLDLTKAYGITEDIKEVDPSPPPEVAKVTTEPPTIEEILHVSARQNDTVFQKGSLRSGQSIRHSGSVVLIGDVNPGGEIMADGNIIVLGALKGSAHAGVKGNRDCFVAALKLNPSRLRIADIITSITDDISKKTPTYAYINDGQIYISNL